MSVTIIPTETLHRSDKLLVVKRGVPHGSEIVFRVYVPGGGALSAIDVNVGVQERNRKGAVEISLLPGKQAFQELTIDGFKTELEQRGFNTSVIAGYVSKEKDLCDITGVGQHLPIFKSSGRDAGIAALALQVRKLKKSFELPADILVTLDNVAIAIAEGFCEKSSGAQKAMAGKLAPDSVVARPAATR